MRVILAFILASLLIAPLCSALPDNYYFTIKNDTEKCIDLIIPDDFGIVMPGKLEYQIKMVPSPWDTWADLSDWVVRTDENETVKNPICFRSYGRTEGQCGENFTITISVPQYPQVPARTISGGVCVSRYQDVDTNPIQPGQGSGDAINENSDMVAMALKKPVQYAGVGEARTYTLQVQSDAELQLDISVLGPGASPSSGTLSTGPLNPYQEFTFTAVSDEPGNHDIAVTARARECTRDFCTRQVSGTLSVTDAPPQQTSFSVNIFPYSINLRQLKHVTYTLMIENQGPAGSFTIAGNIPQGLETDFSARTQEIGQGEEYTLDITLTPSGVSDLYEMGFSVTSLGNTKEATAYLSTNELLTDAMRDGEWVSQNASQEIRQDVGSALDDFYNSYRQSDYGHELDSYTSLKESLDDAKSRKASAQAPQEPDLSPPVQPPSQPAGLDWWIYLIPVIIAAGAAAAYFLLRGRKTQKSVSVSPLEPSY